ncbi:MAG: hypothetical protein M3159_07115 [Actinomycetota bacterium]|nr:hypothetical protein [Actinomycetota bacterium]
MALVIGLLQSGLAIIYVSIGCSVVAGVLLAVAVVRGKPDKVSSGAMPQPAPPAAPASRSWESPQPTPGEPEREREPAMAAVGAGGSGAPDETQQLDQAAIELAVRGDDDNGPIPDYDRLRATEVLPLLAGLDADQLTAVRAQEVAGRNRFMVLSRIDRELEARGPAEATVAPAATSAEWDTDDEWEADSTDTAEDEDEDEDESDEAEADEAPDGHDQRPDRAPAFASSAASGSILDNYEQLKVLEILPRLGELNAEELAQVRRREQAGQRRAMIINRVDRLIVDVSPAASERPARPARQPSVAPSRRGQAKKAAATKAPVKKAPAKKTVAKKAVAKIAAKKAVAKKVAAKKAPAKKVAAKKVAAKKVTAKKSAGSVRKTAKATKKR